MNDGIDLRLKPDIYADHKCYPMFGQSWTLTELLERTKYTVESDPQRAWVDLVSERRVAANEVEALRWEQGTGAMLTIGFFHGCPIVLTCFWVMVNNNLVMFYECNSPVAHWGMIEDWLKVRCNPMGLGNTRLNCNADNISDLACFCKKEKPEPSRV